MIQSMTGFGKSSVELTNKVVHIELKTLNSKQADIYLKIPNAYREAENQIRSELTRELLRGKMEITIWFDLTQHERTVTLNQPVILDYLEQLKGLNQSINLPSVELLLPAVMRLPEVLTVEKQDFDETEWRQVFVGIQEACARLQEFRRQEGSALEQDLLSRIAGIRMGLHRIDVFESQRIDRVRSRLSMAMDEIRSKTTIDPNRFEQELIYYIDKMDITEEKVRLINHLTYFEETINTEEAPGRKLGFISQEMGREINTLGSKANDSNIQKLVVEMKDDLEKIKEQVLNVL